MQAEVGQHVAADQHPAPLAPERQRARRVPGDLQHLEPFHHVAFPQGAADRVGGDRQQGALEPVAPRRAVAVDPAAADGGGVAGAAPQRQIEGVAQPGRAAGVVEVGMGEHVGGELPARQLLGEAAAAPAHPGVEDDGAEQVDVEGAAGPATGQGEAGGQLMQRRRMLAGGGVRRPEGVTWSSRPVHADSRAMPTQPAAARPAAGCRRPGACPRSSGRPRRRRRSPAAAG